MIERLERLQAWSELPGLPLVYIDYREEQSGLRLLLEKLAMLEVKPCQLSSGDVAVGNTGIERKTFADFVRSLKDGRLFRQILLLKRSYTHRLLLIEGVSARPDTPKCFRGAIVKINSGLQVPILYSRDLNDTAAYIHQIAYQQVGLTHKPLPILRRGKSPEDIEFQQIFFLSGIPGVGFARGRALLQHFGSLARVLSAKESELNTVPGIGPKFASEIVTLLNSAFPVRETD